MNVHAGVQLLCILGLPVKLDLANAWTSWDSMVDAAVALLPNLILATIIFILFLIIASATPRAATFIIASVAILELPTTRRDGQLLRLKLL